MRSLVVVFVIFFMASCTKVFLGDDIKSTPRENFNYLWNTLDRKYSFFEYKNVDWNQVYQEYYPLVTDETSDTELFNILFSMLSELKDAHINLTSSFNVSRYDAVFRKAPENYDSRLVSQYYLRSDYTQTGPLLHQTVASGEIGYVRYSSFESSVSKGNIDYVINKYRNLKGLIVDVRNNGGGVVSNVFVLCNALADQRRHVYTSYVKNGSGHEDFSAPNKVYAQPDSKTPYSKPVCILTNRNSYSATSFFVLAMKAFPNITVVGDTTGGGLGAPTGGELPNGWSYRFSCSRTLCPDGINYENGIPPDSVKYMGSSDATKGLDTIIETAISIILSKE
jgi:hypothetical protein